MPNGHQKYMWSSSRSGLNSMPSGEFPRRIVMSDALKAAAATTAAAAATAGRRDAVEQNQIQMTAQLSGVSQQFQTLLGGCAGGSVSSDSEGDSSCGTGDGFMQIRRIDPSGLHKLGLSEKNPTSSTFNLLVGEKEYMTTKE